MDETQSDVYEKLIGSALKFISFRPRSAFEIRAFLETKLRRAHITAPLVKEKVIARLTELGYIDDAAFASWWVSQRTGRKPKGETAILLELQRKGIGKEEAVKAVRLMMQGEKSERQLARAFAEKKIISWKHKPAMEQKQKLAQALMRRGFSSEVVWGVVDEVTKTL